MCGVANRAPAPETGRPVPAIDHELMRGVGRFGAAKDAAGGIEAALQHVTHGGQETRGASLGHASRRRVGMNARVPQRLGCIDVAHAGEHVLVHQHLLYGGATRLEPAAESSVVEFGIPRFGAKGGERRFVARVPSDGGECTRIEQGNAMLRIEGEYDTRMRRQRLVVGPHGPITIKPKVRDARAAIVEVKELVLPSALKRPDDSSAQRHSACGRECAPGGGVGALDVRDALPFDMWAEFANGPLDFWEFWHGENVVGFCRSGVQGMAGSTRSHSRNVCFHTSEGPCPQSLETP